MEQDHIQGFANYTTRHSGTGMRASPGVKNLTISGGLYDGMKNSYHHWEVIELSPEGKELFQFYSHNIANLVVRSRKAALAFRMLQLAEVYHRNNRVKTYMPAVEMLKPRIIANVVNAVDGCLKKMYDIIINYPIPDLLDNFHHYTGEHQISHIDRGLSWTQLQNLIASDEGKLTKLRDAILFCIKRSLDKKLTNIDYNIGMRARAEEYTPKDIKSILNGDRIPANYTRTRIVTFDPRQSSFFCLMSRSDKSKLYKQVFAPWEQWMHTPLSLGGLAYQEVKDLLDAGWNYVPYDAKSWETTVGAFIHSHLPYAVMNVGGMFHLPSGIWGTSIINTVVAAEVIRVVLGRHPPLVLGDNVKVIILGDDISVFVRGKRDLVSSVRSQLDKLPFLEYQDDAADMKHFLGLSYTGIGPHPIGFKCTVDRADKMEHLPLSKYDGDYDLRTTTDVTTAERAAWYKLYTGEVWKQVLSQLGEVTAGEWVAPRQLMEKLRI